MRRVFYLLFIIFFSCNSIKTNESNLTQDTWYLFSEQNSVDSKFQFYSLETTPISLKLNIDGSIDVKENGIIKPGVMSWSFSETKGVLIISHQSQSENWFYKVSSDELNIVIYYNGLNSILRTYYKKDGKWEDSLWVENMNLMNRNTTF